MLIVCVLIVCVLVHGQAFGQLDDARLGAALQLARGLGTSQARARFPPFRDWMDGVLNGTAESSGERAVTVLLQSSLPHSSAQLRSVGSTQDALRARSATTGRLI